MEKSLLVSLLLLVSFIILMLCVLLGFVSSKMVGYLFTSLCFMDFSMSMFFRRSSVFYGMNLMSSFWVLLEVLIIYITGVMCSLYISMLSYMMFFLMVILF